MKKIINYLHLDKVGWIELYFSSLLIMSPYRFLGIELQIPLWIILFVILISRHKSRNLNYYRPLITLVSFILIHDVIWFFLTGSSIYGLIMKLITLGCMIMSLGVFNFDRFRGAINLISLISICGLLYQWSIISAGGEVRPLELPFLDLPDNRLDFSIRPSSFFMEPAAYVAFMYVPIYLSLIERKYLWSVVLILSVFLTTSTTGIVTTFIILFVYVATQKNNLKVRAMTIALGVCMGGALLHFEEFQTGITKLEETDVEKTERISQGPYIVSTMNTSELCIGTLSNGAYEYCIKEGRAPYVFYKDESVYMSTIWMIIFMYGILGLFFYLFFYYKLMRDCKKLIPLVVCLFVVMFSASYGLGMYFVYYSISLILLKSTINEDNAI